MHGCGWDSGAARERSSALAASVASRYALGGERVPEGFLVATEGRREAGALGAFATLAHGEGGAEGVHVLGARAGALGQAEAQSLNLCWHGGAEDSLGLTETYLKPCRLQGASDLGGGGDNPRSLCQKESNRMTNCTYAEAAIQPQSVGVQPHERLRANMTQNRARCSGEACAALTPLFPPGAIPRFSVKDLRNREMRTPGVIKSLFPHTRAPGPPRRNRCLHGVPSPHRQGVAGLFTAVHPYPSVMSSLVGHTALYGRAKRRAPLGLANQRGERCEATARDARTPPRVAAPARRTW